MLKGESNKQRLPHLSFLKNAYKTDNYPFGRFKKRSYPQGFLCFAFFVRWSRSFGQSPGRNKLRPVPGIWF